MVRRPHISIDVREGEAYALSMEEVGGYNPHIAQTVPQRCSDPLLAMAWPPLVAIPSVRDTAHTFMAHGSSVMRPLSSGIPPAVYNSWGDL